MRQNYLSSKTRAEILWNLPKSNWRLHDVILSQAQSITYHHNTDMKPPSYPFL